MKTRMVQLGELGDIVSGSTPRTGVKEFWNGDIPWVTPADLTGHDSVWLESKPKRITKAGFDSCSTRMLPPGSILFSSRAPIGHCALAPYPLCTNQGFKSLVPNDRLEPVYGYYALRAVTPSVVAQGRGATFAEISTEIMEGVRIPLPELSEQKRIAGQLEQADRLRRTRRYALELSDSFLPAAFLSLFGDPVRNDRGWPVFPISVVGVVQGGIQLSAKRNSLPLKKPFLRVANVQRGVLDLAEIKFIGLTEAEFRRTLLVKNDLLLVEGNGNPSEVGRAAKWDASVPECVHQNHLIRVRCGEDAVLPEFLLAQLNGKRGMDYYLKHGRTTSGLVTISTGLVNDFPALVPPMKLQNHFAALVARHERLRAGQREALRQAEHLFQSLLHRAFCPEPCSESRLQPATPP